MSMKTTTHIFWDTRIGTHFMVRVGRDGDLSSSTRCLIENFLKATSRFCCSMTVEVSVSTILVSHETWLPILFNSPSLPPPPLPTRLLSTQSVASNQPVTLTINHEHGL